ncbi:MAG: glycosyltransferase family 1 protein [Proteobacteria bacterium]|nr:MAG: glycosyltransferase family 1 protein [Pseudomonadota bacterium]
MLNPGRGHHHVRVLHIDTEMSWRGGENQIRLLIENAQNSDWQWYLAAPPESQAIERMKCIARPLPVPMRGLAQISAARKIASFCRQNKIQLIDCQSSRAHQLGLMIKFLVPELKLVVHRRVDYPPGKSWGNRLKYINPRIDRYIAISSAIGDVLKTYGVPASQIAVVRSAVDAGPFQNQDRLAARQSLVQELGFKPDVPIIGNVAYITEQKGHETLVRALGILKAKGVAFQAFIAGDGDLREPNEKLAKELNLGSGSLAFLGIRKDVPALLAASDIFALSSNDEGLGTSLLDAVHSGCTLVGTAVGGIPEIIHHEKTGLISPARDGESFARNLETVLLNPTLRKDLASSAKAFVDEEFSLKKMVEGNLENYRQLIHG